MYDITGFMKSLCPIQQYICIIATFSDLCHKGPLIFLHPGLYIFHADSIRGLLSGPAGVVHVEEEIPFLIDQRQPDLRNRSARRQKIH